MSVNQAAIEARRLLQPFDQNEAVSELVNRNDYWNDLESHHEALRCNLLAILESYNLQDDLNQAEKTELDKIIYALLIVLAKEWPENRSIEGASYNCPIEHSQMNPENYIYMSTGYILDIALLKKWSQKRTIMGVFRYASLFQKGILSLSDYDYAASLARENNFYFPSKRAVEFLIKHKNKIKHSLLFLVYIPIAIASFFAPAVGISLLMILGGFGLSMTGTLFLLRNSIVPRLFDFFKRNTATKPANETLDYLLTVYNQPAPELPVDEAVEEDGMDNQPALVFPFDEAVDENWMDAQPAPELPVDGNNADFQVPPPVVYHGDAPAPGGPVVGPAADGVINDKVALEEVEGYQSAPAIKPGLITAPSRHQLRNSRECPPGRLLWLNRLNLHRVQVAPARNDAEVECKSAVRVNP